MKQTESLHVRVTSDDLTDIDQVATSMGITRSAAIRILFRAARPLLDQDDAELNRISLAKRAAEENGTLFYEEYLFHLAREIHQTNGGSFADAWLEAGRRQPTIRDIYLSLHAAAVEQSRRRRRRRRTSKSSLRE